PLPIPIGKVLRASPLRTEIPQITIRRDVCFGLPLPIDFDGPHFAYVFKIRRNDMALRLQVRLGAKWIFLLTIRSKSNLVGEAPEKLHSSVLKSPFCNFRSEERRVGKEWH